MRLLYGRNPSIAALDEWGLMMCSSLWVGHAGQR